VRNVSSLQTGEMLVDAVRLVNLELVSDEMSVVDAQSQRAAFADMTMPVYDSAEAWSSLTGESEHDSSGVRRTAGQRSKSNTYASSSAAADVAAQFFAGAVVWWKRRDEWRRYTESTGPLTVLTVWSPPHAPARAIRVKLFDPVSQVVTGWTNWKWLALSAPSDEQQSDDDDDDDADDDSDDEGSNEYDNEDDNGSRASTAVEAQPETSESLDVLEYVQTVHGQRMLVVPSGTTDRAAGVWIRSTHARFAELRTKFQHSKRRLKWRDARNQSH
jgi:hypothetical protein